MRRATKLKIEFFKELLLDGWSVRQALKKAHLGRSSYIRYYNEIFTPEFKEELERRRFLWVRELEDSFLKPKPSPFKESLNRVFNGKPTPLTPEKRRRFIEFLKWYLSRYYLTQ